MSKHPRAMSANSSELLCSGGMYSSLASISLFCFGSLLMYHVHYVCYALTYARSCCLINMRAPKLSTHKCFHARHDLLFLKNVTPLFFLPFSPPFAFLYFLYYNIYFYNNSKSNKNRTLPDWLGGTLFIYSRLYRSLEHLNTQVIFPWCSGMPLHARHLLPAPPLVGRH